MIGYLLFEASARAQIPEDSQILAETELKSGNKLRLTDMAGACQHFRTGMELFPSATLLTRIGECNEHEGLLRRALADYRRALELNRQLNGDRPQHQASLQREIQGRLAGLTVRIPKLTIAVTPRPKGLEILLDGESLAESELDEPVPVDRADTHHLVARAPGYEDASTDGNRDLAITLVPVLEPAAAAGPPLATPVPRSPAPSSASLPRSALRRSVPNPPRARPGLDQRLTGYIAGASGLATSGAAAYFGFRTLWLVHQAEPYCYSDGCEDPGYHRLEQASRTQTVAFVLAGAGVATLSLGVILVMTAPSAEASSRRRDKAAEFNFGIGPSGVIARETW